MTGFSLSLGSFFSGSVRKHLDCVGGPFAFPWQACANGMGPRDRGHTDLLDVNVGCDDGLPAGLCWYLARYRNPNRRMRMKSSRRRIRQLHAVCGRCNILLLRVSGIDEMLLMLLSCVPLELFFPMPSLSTTSSAHWIRRRSDGSAGSALRRRVVGPGWEAVRVRLL